MYQLWYSVSAPLDVFVTGVLIAAGVACALIAVKSSKTRDYALVGNCSSIAHGNIVAFLAFGTTQSLHPVVQRPP